MADVAAVLISATFLAPAVATALLGAWMMLSSRRLPERAVVTLVGSALWASVAVSTGVLGLFLVGLRGEVEVGEWVRLGSYVVPIVYSVDRVAVVFSLLAALSTALVVRFSATYLHLEPGFARFFLLLGIFGTGVQLVAFAGALDLMFAGWERSSSTSGSRSPPRPSWRTSRRRRWWRGELRLPWWERCSV